MRIWRGSEYLPLSHIILKVVRIVGAETFVCFKEGNRKRRKGHSGKAEGTIFEDAKQIKT